jgi:ATP-dependent DNA helicase RecG
MYYFDFVQCAYEGTRRMRMSMQEADLPDPIFTQRESGIFQVSVTLKNNVEHRKNFVRLEAMSAIDPLLYESLSESERVLVNWCAEGKRITVKDAQGILGDMAADWRAARAVLDSLTNTQIFDRPPGKDRDRHRKWFLRKRRSARTPRAQR